MSMTKSFTRRVSRMPTTQLHDLLYRAATMVHRLLDAAEETP
jgi:hypothetical protein